MSGTPLAGDAVTRAVVAGWYNSASMTRRIAARLARELAGKPCHERVDSSMKIAARYGVSNTMAVNARHLLMGARIIYKKDRHYYVAET